MLKEVQNNNVILPFQVNFKKFFSYYLFYALCKENKGMNLINHSIIKDKQVSFTNDSEILSAENAKNSLLKVLESITVNTIKLTKEIVISFSNLKFFVNHLIGIKTCFFIAKVKFKINCFTRLIEIYMEDVKMSNYIFDHIVEKEAQQLGNLFCSVIVFLKSELQPLNSTNFTVKNKHFFIKEESKKVKSLLASNINSNGKSKSNVNSKSNYNLTTNSNINNTKQNKNSDYDHQKNSKFSESNTKNLENEKNNNHFSNTGLMIDGSDKYKSHISLNTDPKNSAKLSNMIDDVDNYNYNFKLMTNSMTMNTENFNKNYESDNWGQNLYTDLMNLCSLLLLKGHFNNLEMNSNNPDSMKMSNFGSIYNTSNNMEGTLINKENSKSNFNIKEGSEYQENKENREDLINYNQNNFKNQNNDEFNYDELMKKVNESDFMDINYQLNELNLNDRNNQHLHDIPEDLNDISNIEYFDNDIVECSTITNY